MLLNPTSHVAAMEASTCASAGEVGPDVVLSLLVGPTWSLSTPMCSNPLACQWNVQSTTRLSLNLVLHHCTTANIVSQQLSLPKYGASWMSTLKKGWIVFAPVVHHTPVAHQLSSLERRQVNCA